MIGRVLFVVWVRMSLRRLNNLLVSFKPALAKNISYLVQSGFTDAVTRSDGIGSEEKLFLRFTFHV